MSLITHTNIEIYHRESCVDLSIYDIMYEKVFTDRGYKSERRVNRSQTQSKLFICYLLCSITIDLNNLNKLVFGWSCSSSCKYEIKWLKSQDWA